jgi:hypothetical protein
VISTRLVALGAALVIAGCGSSPAKPSPPTIVETAQQPANLPPGWSRHLDNAHGFSLAVPPDWEKSDLGDSVLFRSPDHLVALSLSVDRTPAAFQSPPAEFARQTLAALSGYRSELKPGPPRAIGGTPLQGVVVESRGVTVAGSIAQDVQVAVLRRDRLVNYTAVIAANAKSTPAPEGAQAARMLRTVRDLPIA